LLDRQQVRGVDFEFLGEFLPLEAGVLSGAHHALAVVRDEVREPVALVVRAALLPVRGVAPVAASNCLAVFCAARFLRSTVESVVSSASGLSSWLAQSGRP